MNTISNSWKWSKDHSQQREWHKQNGKAQVFGEKVNTLGSVISILHDSINTGTGNYFSKSNDIWEETIKKALSVRPNDPSDENRKQLIKK